MTDERKKECIEFITSIGEITMQAGFNYSEGFVMFKTIIDVMILIDKNPNASDSEISLEILTLFEKYVRSKNL